MESKDTATEATSARTKEQQQFVEELKTLDKMLDVTVEEVVLRRVAITKQASKVVDFLRDENFAVPDGAFDVLCPGQRRPFMIGAILGTLQQISIQHRAMLEG